MTTQNNLFRQHSQCTKNPQTKLFGLIKFNGPHNFKVISVHRWAFHKYEILGRCEHCGAEQWDFGFTSGELMAVGVEVPKWR